MASLICHVTQGSGQRYVQARGPNFLYLHKTICLCDAPQNINHMVLCCEIFCVRFKARVDTAAQHIHTHSLVSLVPLAQ